MTPPVEDSVDVEAARRLLAMRATLFALIACILAALSLLTSPPWGPLGLALGIALLGAPAAALLSGRSLLANRLASAMLAAAVALYGIVIATSTGTGRADFVTPLADFAFWPAIIVALAAGRALDDLSSLADTRRGRDEVWRALLVARGDTERFARTMLSSAAYTLAALVFVLSVAFAVAAGAGSAADALWLVKSPVHVALLALASACAVLVLAAALERQAAPLPADAAFADLLALSASARRRFLRTLIALLPVLGFVGTVLGIMEALAALPEGFSGAALADDAGRRAFAASLTGIATAFETTLIGLVASLAFQLALAVTERGEAGRLVDRMAATRRP